MKQNCHNCSTELTGRHRQVIACAVCFEDNHINEATMSEEPAEYTTGPMSPGLFKSIRKHLFLNQTELAEILLRSIATIIRYEGGSEIPGPVERKMRDLLVESSLSQTRPVFLEAAKRHIKSPGDVEKFLEKLKLL